MQLACLFPGTGTEAPSSEGKFFSMADGRQFTGMPLTSLSYLIHLHASCKKTLIQLDETLHVLGSLYFPPLKQKTVFLRWQQGTLSDLDAGHNNAAVILRLLPEWELGSSSLLLVQFIYFIFIPSFFHRSPGGSHRLILAPFYLPNNPQRWDRLRDSAWCKTIQ